MADYQLIRRMGSKRAIHKKIIALFPPHNTYIDLFFGAGGIALNKPLANFNFWNDKDGEIFNLFDVLRRDKLGLLEWTELMPYHNDLFQFWRKNKETDPILKALRFLMLSNFGFMGNTKTMRFGGYNTKETFIENIKNFNLKFDKVQFLNCDFEDVFGKIQFKYGTDKKNAFVYADPPYLGTGNNYPDDCQFTENDTERLFDVLVKSGIRFGISEFAHPKVLALAEKYGLFVTYVTARHNLGDRRAEIYIHNYQINNLFS